MTLSCSLDPHRMDRSFRRYSTVAAAVWPAWPPVWLWTTATASTSPNSSHDQEAKMEALTDVIKRKVISSEKGTAESSPLPRTEKES